MKKHTAIHWILSVLISSFMLFSAWFTGTHKTEFARMGFPNYFRIELTLLKIIGALALLIPQLPHRVREWIYVSFGIVLISASIAKLNSGYPITGAIEPLFVLTLLIGSAIYLDRVEKQDAHDDRMTFSPQASA